MTRRYQHTLTRRTLLRGAGVAMALPLLESLLPRTAFGAPTRPGPHRIVAINIPLGFHGPSFFPTEVGENYTATASLAPAAAIRDKFTLISGTSHPDVDGGHSAEVSFLTAAPHPGARSFKNTISLDQLIARQVGSQTRFGSLTLGDQSLSWSANGVAIPAEKDPGNAYSKLFLQGSVKQLADQRRRLEDGHSVIDVLLEDANAMRGKLSKRDQDKLQQYFTAVRETEQRLQKAEVWAKTPKPMVDASQPPRLP
ncbi:MAG TPA: DUF1552 domain-containing protein, partial [Pirellulaceae bacterium]|nr:DUF1552 domain-containing protein [Pirellulaceae bacterium]